MARLSTFRTVASTLWLLVLLYSSAANVIANEQTYTPRSEEEVEVFSLVVASEIKANNWAHSEVICFSVNGLDPSAKLVKSLHKRNFSVRSSAEWPKKFNCGFKLQFEYTQFDLSRIIKVRSKVVDFREINKGEGDLALLLKDGEYTLQKVDGKWSIREYVEKPLGPHSSSRGLFVPPPTTQQVGQLPVGLSEAGRCRVRVLPKYVLAGCVVYERPLCGSIRSDPLPRNL